MTTKRELRRPSPQDRPQDQLSLTAAVSFGGLEAAAASPEGGDATPKAPKFSMLAYSGGPMRLAGFRDPVVIDLAGLDLGVASLPILADHMPYAEYAVGHTTSKIVANGSLQVEGVISGVGEMRDRIVALAKNGFPWQASVGFSVSRVERVEAGSSANVNGKTVAGPLNVVRASRLREVSFVVLGADDQTTSRVAASASKGDLQMEPKTGADGQTGTAEAQGAPAPNAVDAMNAEIAANYQRVAAIQATCKDHPEIAAQAIREKWTPERAELAVLRASRPSAGAPAVHVADNAVKPDTILAAAMLSAKIDPLKEGLSPQAVDLAAKQYRHGIGLTEIILECARANGYDRRSVRGDEGNMLRAAFSTMEISGILSNVGNKVLLRSFEAVEQVWRKIANVVPVKDFKTVTAYRLTGSMKFEKVSPAGELRHGKAGQESYTISADSFGKLFAITRQDLINDDLGALTGQAKRLGRGAGLALNDIFWTTFNDNSAWLPASNELTGGTTALSLTSLATAEKAFLEQKDADGFFIGARPALMLVPPALSVKAAEIFASTEIRDTTASTKAGTTNVFKGRYPPETSAYIGGAGAPLGSDTAWYLVANPDDIAAMEVAFLNGVETPTIETAEADFNMLGIQMRGYFDFGVAQKDYRGIVKSAGA